MGLWIFGVVGVLLLAAVFLVRRTGSNEPQAFVCSACMKTYPFAEIRVLPWWNPDVHAILTSYRCGACFPTSLRETRDAIATLDDKQRESFVEFLRSHKLDVLAAEVEGASLDGARAALGKLLDEVESGELKLSV
jgi:hypothetical protein